MAITTVHELAEKCVRSGSRLSRCATTTITVAAAIAAWGIFAAIGYGIYLLVQ